MYSNAMWKSLQEWPIVENGQVTYNEASFHESLRPLARAYHSMAKAYPDTEGILQLFSHLRER